MNSPVCVDASADLSACGQFGDHPHSRARAFYVPNSVWPSALALLGTWRQDDTTLIAPALLAFEVTSTLRRYVYLKEIAPSHGEKAFDRFLRMDIRLSHRRGIFPLAWNLAKADLSACGQFGV